MNDKSDGGEATEKRASAQFPTPGRIVHVFPNGDTKSHPFPGMVARALTAGDAFGSIHVAGCTPEGAPIQFLSVQHASKAAKGAACWDWPARA